MDEAKTYIQVSAGTLKENNATGAADPPILVYQFSDGIWEVTKAHEVKILGTSSIVYNPVNTLEIPAVVWVETSAPVVPVLDRDVL